jgi:hypothetical protein
MASEPLGLQSHRYKSFSFCIVSNSRLLSLSLSLSVYFTFTLWFPQILIGWLMDMMKVIDGWWSTHVIKISSLRSFWFLLLKLLFCFSFIYSFFFSSSRRWIQKNLRTPSVRCCIWEKKNLFSDYLMNHNLSLYVYLHFSRIRIFIFYFPLETEIFYKFKLTIFHVVFSIIRVIFLFAILISLILKHGFTVKCLTKSQFNF